MEKNEIAHVYVSTRFFDLLNLNFHGPYRLVLFNVPTFFGEDSSISHKTRLAECTKAQIGSYCSGDAVVQKYFNFGYMNNHERQYEMLQATTPQIQSMPPAIFRRHPIKVYSNRSYQRISLQLNVAEKGGWRTNADLTMHIQFRS